jgi:hypothetical protein
MARRLQQVAEIAATGGKCLTLNRLKPSVSRLESAVLKHRAWFVGFSLCLVACGRSSNGTGGGFILAGFPLAGQKQTPSASTQDELSRGVQNPACDHTVELLDANTLPRLKYSVIASTMVRCDQRAIAYCRRQLAERACNLRGDAVIVDPPEARPVPTGTPRRDDVNLSGHVIKYER